MSPSQFSPEKMEAEGNWGKLGVFSAKLLGGAEVEGKKSQ